jgi:hypothetical protein
MMFWGLSIGILKKIKFFQKLIEKWWKNGEKHAFFLEERDEGVDKRANPCYNILYVYNR